MSGYKTYIVAISSIAVAVGGFLKGAVTFPDLLEVVTTALAAAGIRHGVSTTAAKE